MAIASGLALATACSQPNDLRALDEIEDEIATTDAGPDATDRGDDCEDAVRRESTCSAGIGACERSGSLACNDEGEPVCSASAGAPKAELCGNELDDDCDGTTDEASEGTCCEDRDCDMDKACERDAVTGVAGTCMAVGDAHADCERHGNALVCTCQLGYTGDGLTCARDFCVALEDDEAPCGPNQACSSQKSEALCECQEGFEDCDDAAPNGCEANVLEDSANCGACGEGCASDLGCVEGECEPRVSTMVLGTNGTLAKGGNGTWLGAGAAVTPAPGSPMFVQTIIPPAAAYALATYHGCGLRDAGSAFCWGSHGSNNLLGTSDTTVTQFEIPKAGIRAIAANQLNTCVAGAEGAVYCWGSPYTGAWGDGVIPTTRVPPRASAEAFSAPVMGVVGAVKLHVGDSMFCALTEGKFAWCWGSSGSTGFAPESVKGPDGLPLGEIEDIAGGLDHACALLADKTVVCWGDPANGVLGTSTSPVGRHHALRVALENVRSIASGASHVCAALEDGTVHCWGRNSVGELGSAEGSSSAEPLAVELPEDERAVQVFSGSASLSTCAQMRSGSVFCWGFNRYGNLGVPLSSTGKNPPIEVTSWP